MLIALISDIHANLPAFRVVLDEIDKIKPDKILCLGDVVGYGPQPNEVIDILRERNIETVIGNHDAAAAGLFSSKSFKEPNQTLIKITRELLTEENKNWIRHLPMALEGENWIAAHATPLVKDHWPYMNSGLKCMDILKQIKHDFCFIGHTHRPGLVADQFGVIIPKKGNRFVINPGSVGQSRDQDKRASFCTVDIENFTREIYRCSYEFGETLSYYEGIGMSREQGKKLLHLDRMF